ncbi:ChbG/HpnK family deacetylase [Alcaligenes sp. SDU_A2]|uniref:ChbG/HpnK family deacetylase n=1 Tax=Alcaligenes sp. SDU_A2 TaxID=3136634 RepID=UPI00311DEAC3
MAKERQISICADDFGMAPAVDAAVLALEQIGRLSGTSCLVDGASFAQNAPALRQTRLQKGLHLNFTEFGAQEGVYAMPLKRVIVLSFLHKLDPDRIKASIARQLDRFEQALGQAPDYIDGHQHVHQLPQIRQALLDEMQRRYPHRMPWLRYTGAQRLGNSFSLGERFKARVIAALGADALAHLAVAKGVTLNTGFTGVYDFKGGQARYSRLVQAWLAAMRHGDSLMCHPALEAVPGDPLGAQRLAEYQVLSGSDMEQWLDRYSLRIA